MKKILFISSCRGAAYTAALLAALISCTQEERNKFPSKSDGQSSEPANCYIISAPGTYSFPTVKGNSKQSVGNVSSAEVLWESFGTSEMPNHGDIIKSISYESGIISYTTPNTLTNGNAVIAAKDASGNILWSWHIWCCEDFIPETTAQTYYNNAGVMMDRNLGATTAKQSSVGSQGLLYQWGRKDPFLGSSDLPNYFINVSYSSSRAVSTIGFHKAKSSAQTGTIDYTIQRPTTFLTSDRSDWTYSSSTDDTRWLPSKTIFDPCPAGWHVPVGGSSGVWARSVGSGGSFIHNRVALSGMDFSGMFGDDNSIWYPACPSLTSSLTPYFDGTCKYWSSTKGMTLLLKTDIQAGRPTYADSTHSCEDLTLGLPVRCMKE